MVDHHIFRALLQRTGGEIMAVEPLAGEGHKNAAGLYLAAIGGDQLHLRVTGQFSGRHQPCQKLACMDLFHCSIPSRSIYYREPPHRILYSGLFGV